MAMATLLSKCRQHSAVLQLSKTSVAVYSFISSSAQVLSSSSPIIGIDIWDSFVLTWSETKAELFNIQESGRHLETSFSSSANDHFALHRNFIFRAQGMTIQVLDLQGSLNHKLELNEPQGNVVGLDVSEDFLVVATENGYLQMWRFVDGFWKTFLPDMGRKVALVTKGPCNICSLKCNYNGTKVSFVVGRKTGELLASTLCIYDSGLDKFYHHDFSSKGKMLVTHCWDSEEFQQFACQVKPVDGRKYGLDAQSGILTFFVDNMKGIIKLDKKDIEDDKVSLLGKHEPYLYIFEKLSYDENHLPKAPLIKKIPVGIVASMENVDRKTRQDLLNFTTAIFTGRMMEAYRFIESMNDILTLKKMAYYCMEHELLDAAMSCFAQMGRAYAVSAIDSMNYGDPNLHENETKAAMVAIHLGCIEDAEKLYIKCKRYDLLAELYQTCGNWDKAIETSSKYDSLNLKNLHHTYAKYLEAIGDIQKAVHHYELSNTHRYEVPHMLYSIGRVDDLKKYIDEKKDLSLHKWWANYCEAQNLLQDAIEQYKLVRLLEKTEEPLCIS